MYTRHFGLQTEPFALTPDPAFLYLSPAHHEALAALKIGLLGRRGLTVMTGEIGTGKTTLLYSLLTELGPEIRTAYLANTRLPFDDLLRQALVDFGIPDPGGGRLELLRALNTFLLQCAAKGITPALVVDEAQNLDADMFENLRLLLNVETFVTKLLQIVLVGQPELIAKLAQPALRQVAERVAVCCRIGPLSRKESHAYIAHRLRHAGGSTDLFTRGALRLVFWKARGIPRRMNILCHNALLFAFGHGAARASVASVIAAVRASEVLNSAGRRRYHADTPPFVSDSAAAPAVLSPPAPPRKIRLGPACGGAVFALFALAVAELVSSGQLTTSVTPRADHAPAPPAVAVAAASQAHRAVEPRSVIPDRPAVNASAASAEHPGSTMAEGAPAAVKPPGAAAEPLDRHEVASGAGATGVAETRPITARDSLGDNRPPASDPAAPPSGAAHRASRMVQVTRGDTLSVLTARVYGVTTPTLLQQVQAANPQIMNPNHIFAGDALRFPAASPVGAAGGSDE